MVCPYWLFDIVQLPLYSLQWNHRLYSFKGNFPTHYSSCSWCSCLHEEVPLILYCNWLPGVMVKIGLQDRAPDLPMSLHAAMRSVKKEKTSMFGWRLNIQNWPFLPSMGCSLVWYQNFGPNAYLWFFVTPLTILAYLMSKLEVLIKFYCQNIGGSIWPSFDKGGWSIMHMSPYISEQGILHQSKFGLYMYMNKGENELVDRG